MNHLQSTGLPKRLFEKDYPALQTSPPTPLLAKERGVKPSPGLSPLPLARGGLGRGQSTLLTSYLYSRTFKTISKASAPQFTHLKRGV
jgi:hypothetical protein